MEENKNINELMEAYEADKKRKLRKDDELKDAREYLNVLLQEAEDKNVELENSQKETRELREKLESKIAEVKELTDGSKARNRRRSFVAWVAVAIVELVCIIGLIVFFIYIKPDSKEPVPEQETTVPEDSDVQIINNVTYVRHDTKKYNENLEKSVLSSDFTDAEFSGKVEKIDGLEYLTFSNGRISVSYKNEYYADEVNFRKAIIVEKGDKRYIFSGSYDLSAPILSLSPILTGIGGDEYLVFTDNNSTCGDTIMSSLKLFNTGNFKFYENDKVEKTLLDLFDFEYINATALLDRVTADAAQGTEEESQTPADVILDEKFAIEEDFVVLIVTTPKAEYRYRLSLAQYDDLTYYEEDDPDISRDFHYEIDETGIHWTTFLRLGDDYVLGEYSGDLIPSNDVIAVSAAKYGAFVQKEFADVENYEFITPASEVPEHYYALGWGGNRRILITIDTSLKQSTIDNSRMDVSDPNNRVYMDADGIQASIKGIDVSKYQGKIDWGKVAADGVEFALIRLGYRGMNEGTLELDNYFKSNIEQATAHGVKCGVYFFSEAVNEAEAVAEAEFVLRNIKNYNLTYPIAFDTERITTFDARANKLSMAERTDACIAFCERIKEAGYTPMIYANSTYFLTGLDLNRLEDYDKWYAVYSENVTFPYEYSILQYTDSGHVDGVSGTVDINIAFKDFAGME